MANIKADEISQILREQIENYQQTVAVEAGRHRLFRWATASRASMAWTAACPAK
jgi:hypothetical protein